MLCFPSNFLNFGIIIYYTTKIEESNLIFLFYCAKWVIKWENHKIKINKPYKKSLSLIHFSYIIIKQLVVGQTN